MNCILLIISKIDSLHIIIQIGCQKIISKLRFRKSELYDDMRSEINQTILLKKYTTKLQTRLNMQEIRKINLLYNISTLYRYSTLNNSKFNGEEGLKEIIFSGYLQGKSNWRGKIQSNSLFCFHKNCLKKSWKDLIWITIGETGGWEWLRPGNPEWVQL